MIKFFGTKVGMTQIHFDMKAVPVTILSVDNWLVTQIKTLDVDGYNAIQVGRLRDDFLPKNFTLDWIKNLKKYFSVVKETSVFGDSVLEVGSVVDVFSIFKEGAFVDVSGITKGRGFAGVVKRHNFGGPPGSHGSKMGKRPGSIGFMRSQGKVIKGKKLPGHLGAVKRMVSKLEIISIDVDSRVLMIKGSVPGKIGSLVCMQKV